MRALLALTLFATPAAAATFTPGLWESTSAPTAAKLPGMDAAMEKRFLETARAEVSPVRTCIDIDPSLKPELLMPGLTPLCVASQSVVADGRIALTRTCEGGTTEVATGSYTAGSYTASYRTVANGDNDGLIITTGVQGRRVGDCPRPAPKGEKK